MKAYKDVCIIEGKLASLMNIYLRPIREGRGFEQFSDECILYSLLELSKFNRAFNDEERLVYLFDKCCDYSNYNYEGEAEFDYDGYGNFFIITNDTLPF